MSALLLATFSLSAAEPADGANPKSKAKDDKTPAGVSATDSPETARKRLVVAPGLKVDLWAAEPLIENVVSFSFDEQGRAYVVETGRRRTSVFDIRSYRDWVDADLSFRTPWDRAAFLKTNVSQNNAAFMRQMSTAKTGGFADFNKDGRLDWRDLEVESERIKLVWDSTGSGLADKSAVFADGFNTSISGVAAGVLARRGEVYFTSIPDVWRFTNYDLRFTNGQPALPLPFTPTTATRLHTGFGTHIAYGGHDMHGLKFGPDGKLYWTIADRGAALTNLSRTLNPDLDYLLKFLPDTGAVFRSNPDGSELEVVAIGLRNPQELAFDDFGNLFTADNNADGGDKARWVHIVESADYGWRYGWQHLPKLGAWNSEMLWGLAPSNTALSYPPPVAHIGHGPAGIAHYPGTGLPDTFRDCFFYADFPGGIRYFRLEPSGASFRVANAGKWLESNSPDEREGKLLWNLYPTDIEFGPDGGAYVLDWVAGWEKTGKGRIWRVHDPAVDASATVKETKRLLAADWSELKPEQLGALLGHANERIRSTAQAELLARVEPDGELVEVERELAARRRAVVTTLDAVAKKGPNRIARVHAVWSFGNLNRDLDGLQQVLPSLESLLDDPDEQVRAAAVTAVSNFSLDSVRLPTPNLQRLLKRLGDLHPLVRLKAAEGVGRLCSKDFLHELLEGAPEPFLTSFKQDVQERNTRNRVAVAPLLDLLRTNADQDATVRHAAVHALVRVSDTDALLAAAKDSSASVRLGACLALRRLMHPGIAQFLDDPDLRIVLEAARAIADLPIEPALPKLAALTTLKLPNRTSSPSLPQSGGEGRGEEARPPAKQGSPLPNPLPARASQGEGAGAPRVSDVTALSSDLNAFILRRALNAHFRLGQPTNALALAAFAVRGDAPEPLRVEALDMLADWPQPSSRDKITGLWRPLAPREAKPAADAFRPAATALLAANGTAIPVAALATMEKLTLTDLAPSLLALVKSATAPAEVRAAALRTLHHSSFIPHTSSLAAEALKLALTDAAETLRKEASRLSAVSGGTDAIARLAATLQTGTLGERQSALQSLAGLKGKEADDALRKALTQLLEGKLAKELHLDVLEAAAKRTSPSIKERLAQFEAKRDAKDPLAKWRECLTGGDAKAGKILFHERQEAACARCHKLAGEGGDVGPELAGLTAKRGREYVLESIVLPNRVIAPGFESLLVVMKNGQSFAGLVKGETGDELTLNSPEDGLLKLKKSDIAKRTPALSPMPESLIEVLTKREIRDLVEFLATVK
jgi:quinoprotein glucose dehydrogenase